MAKKRFKTHTITLPLDLEVTDSPLVLRETGVEFENKETGTKGEVCVVIPPAAVVLTVRVKGQTGSWDTYQLNFKNLIETVMAHREKHGPPGPP